MLLITLFIIKLLAQISIYNLIKPLSERRGQRRLAVFNQYHHTNTATLFRYVRPAKHATSHRHPDHYFIPV